MRGTSVHFKNYRNPQFFLIFFAVARFHVQKRRRHKGSALWRGARSCDVSSARFPCHRHPAPLARDGKGPRSAQRPAPRTGGIARHAPQRAAGESAVAEGAPTWQARRQARQRARQASSPLGVFRSNHYVWWCPITSKYKDPSDFKNDMRLFDKNCLCDDPFPKSAVECSARRESGLSPAAGSSTIPAGGSKSGKPQPNGKVKAGAPVHGPLIGESVTTVPRINLQGEKKASSHPGPGWGLFCRFGRVPDDHHLRNPHRLCRRRCGRVRRRCDRPGRLLGAKTAA
jgi:hypothetical protein